MNETIAPQTAHNRTDVIKEPVSPQATHNRTDVLNVLRVTATLFVFFLHGRGYIDGINETKPLFGILTSLPAWAGVWILFFLSGYLMQKGFDAGRYVVFGQPGPHRKRYFAFVGKRLAKIAPAYYIYLLLFFVLQESTYPFAHPLAMLRVLTFTFNGNGGISGMGHLWYISLAVWMYALAPFFAWLIEKTRRLMRGVFPVMLLTLVIAAGLGARFLMRSLGLGWYDWVYTFLPMNLDLFFGGMLAAAVTRDRIGCAGKRLRMLLKVSSAALFVVLVSINCYVYYKEQYLWYQYVMPTLYLTICAFLCFSFDGQGFVYEKPTWPNIRKNPLRLIDAFSPLTYAFYIFHIMAFRFWDVNLHRFSFYQNLPTDGKWVVFFALSFALTLGIAWCYTKMIAVFRRKKFPAATAAVPR